MMLHPIGKLISRHSPLCAPTITPLKPQIDNRSLMAIRNRINLATIYLHTSPIGDEASTQTRQMCR